MEKMWPFKEIFQIMKGEEYKDGELPVQEGDLVLDGEMSPWEKACENFLRDLKKELARKEESTVGIRTAFSSGQSIADFQGRWVSLRKKIFLIESLLLSSFSQYFDLKEGDELVMRKGFQLVVPKK